MCGPKLARLWAVPSLGLTRFSALRSLTLHEVPALASFWLSRLPLSLESLTIVVVPRSERANVPNNT